MKNTEYICECGKKFNRLGSIRSHKSQCKIHLAIKQKLQEQEMKARQLSNGKFQCENPLCKKEHDGTYGSGRFCCKKCAKQYNGITSYKTSVKNNTRKNNLANYLSSQKSPYGTWKCKECNQVFETRRDYQKHLKAVHPQRAVKGGWNKGLTKETNSSVNKGASLQKRLYEKGKLHVWCEGKHLKKSTREKISASRLKNIKEHGGFSHIGWYKVQNLNGIEFTVRGTWELNVAKRLSALGYLWIKKIHIPYTIDIKRNYFPDFYIPSINSYVEVKGYYSDADKQKMKAVLSCNKGIKIFFISANVYEDFINGKVKLDNSLLLNMATC